MEKWWTLVESNHVLILFRDALNHQTSSVSKHIGQIRKHFRRLAFRLTLTGCTSHRHLFVHPCLTGWAFPMQDAFAFDLRLLDHFGFTHTMSIPQNVVPAIRIELMYASL